MDAILKVNLSSSLVESLNKLSDHVLPSFIGKLSLITSRYLIEEGDDDGEFQREDFAEYMAILATLTASIIAIKK